MATSKIRLSNHTKKTLASLKLHPRETYEEVLERLLEDLRDLSDQTTIEISEASTEIKQSKFRTQEKLRADMSF